MTRDVIFDLGAQRLIHQSLGDIVGAIGDGQREQGDDEGARKRRKSMPGVRAG
jgi:hypothetical protein